MKEQFGNKKNKEDIMINVPTFQTVLTEMKDLVPSVYEALDFGIFKSRNFFEEQKKVIDRYLAPDLVRYYACELLKKRFGENISETYEPSLYPVPNIGILIECGIYKIRLLKGDELPVPINSVSRQMFYQQKEPTFSFYDDLEVKQDSQFLNLIVLWDVDYEYKLLRKLSLACPKSGGDTKESVDVFWMETIPETYYFKKTADTTEYKDVGTEDLPITRERISETGTDEQ
jgi:hypothetical protein